MKKKLGLHPDIFFCISSRRGGKSGRVRGKREWGKGERERRGRGEGKGKEREKEERTAGRRGRKREGEEEKRERAGGEGKEREALHYITVHYITLH